MLYLKLFLYKKQEDKRYGTNIVAVPQSGHKK